MISTLSSLGSSADVLTPHAIAGRAHQHAFSDARGSTRG
jgi:hypothetical protein